VLSSYIQGYAMGPEPYEYITGDDRILINLPMFHVGGTVFMVVTLANGGSCFLDTHFKTAEFWQTARENQITMTCLLGAMIPFLLKLPPSDDENDHVLRKATCVPWNEDTAAVGRRFGIEMRTTFNMTEVSSPMISDPFPPGAGTCGKVRPGIEARVVDENDCQVPPGVAGELILRADRPWDMNHGYYKNPEATAAAITPEGWFRTGDLGQIDPDGYLMITGRAKEMFIVGGSNAYPAEIERFLEGHENIHQAVVCGVPDARMGEVGFTFVMPVPGTDLNADDVIAHCRGAIADYKVPRYVEVVEDFPRTSTNKIQRYLLQQDAMARFEEREESHADD